MVDTFHASNADNLYRRVPLPVPPIQVGLGFICIGTSALPPPPKAWPKRAFRVDPERRCLIPTGEEDEVELPEDAYLRAAQAHTEDERLAFLADYGSPGVDPVPHHADPNSLYLVKGAGRRRSYGLVS